MKTTSMLALVAALAGVGCARSSATEPRPSRRAEQTIAVTAKKFAFSPDKIVLHRGVPATIELRSLDRKHGFAVPELGIRVEVTPNAPVRVRMVPQKSGTFPFHCDVFCGEGHETMAGEIVVAP